MCDSFKVEVNPAARTLFGLVLVSSLSSWWVTSRTFRDQNTQLEENYPEEPDIKVH